MKEQLQTRQTSDNISLRRHPILGAKLAWTTRRIAVYDNRAEQAKRILSLRHTTESAKKEARTNSKISRKRLFALQTHREDLLRKAQNKR